MELIWISEIGDMVLVYTATRVEFMGIPLFTRKEKFKYVNNEWIETSSFRKISEKERRQLDQWITANESVVLDLGSEKKVVL